MDHNHFRKLSQVAQGLTEADLVLKNGNIINVFTEEIIKADIAITDGIIVGVGKYNGREQVDVSGKYISPGFIDSHLHFESTLVPMAELVHHATPWGTTTYIIDPHEAVNVSGSAGLDYILDQLEEIPANVFVMLPSCVPATPGEDNGAEFTASDMERYLEHPKVLGLGEVMDYHAVINADVNMFKKLNLFTNARQIIDGHAPGLSDQQLAAYTLAGIATDHESYDYEYALKQIRNGIQVLIREGSAARNLEAIVKGIVENKVDTSNFSFCTDDKHIEDIRTEGHISYNIKKAIALGLDPIKAIKMATINAAKCYGLKNLGAIAPGYQADLVVLEDLETVKIDSVYFKAKLVTNETPIYFSKAPEKLKNTVKVKPITAEQLQLKISENPISVIQMVDHQIVTKHIKVSVPQKNNVFTPTKEYNKVAVIERHRASGKIGLAVVTGFGITGGAIASSVSHDSHNIIVIGDNDTDMLLAVEELGRSQGGYTIVANGQVANTLELPIMGLFTDAGFEHVHPKLKSMITQAYQMGVSTNMDPFLTLAFLALPVIPEIRLTTNGLYDVINNEYIFISQ